MAILVRETTSGLYVGPEFLGRCRNFEHARQFASWDAFVQYYQLKLSQGDQRYVGSMFVACDVETGLPAALLLNEMQAVIEGYITRIKALL